MKNPDTDDSNDERQADPTDGVTEGMHQVECQVSAKCKVRTNLRQARNKLSRSAAPQKWQPTDVPMFSGNLCDDVHRTEYTTKLDVRESMSGLHPGAGSSTGQNCSAPFGKGKAKFLSAIDGIVPQHPLQLLERHFLKNLQSSFQHSARDKRKGQNSTNAFHGKINPERFSDCKSTGSRDASVFELEAKHERQDVNSGAVPNQQRELSSGKYYFLSLTDDKSMTHERVLLLCLFSAYNKLKLSKLRTSFKNTI